MKQQETIENERCYISELMSLVGQSYTDYEFRRINPSKDATILPIWHKLPIIKKALDELYDLAANLCLCVGQVELDDKHDWRDVDITAEQSICRLLGCTLLERQVLYTVDISDEDQSFLKNLEVIYGEETRDDYHNERDYIIEKLNDSLLRLNANDDEYTWKVYNVWHRGDEKRIILVIDAYRKDNDNEDTDN